MLNVTEDRSRQKCRDLLFYPPLTFYFNTYLANPLYLNQMKQIMSLILALLMLSSQLSFSTAVHFCGDIAVESSLLLFHGNPEGCGMETDNSCPSPQDYPFEIAKKQCCQDVIHDCDQQLEYSFGGELSQLPPAYCQSGTTEFAPKSELPIFPISPTTKRAPPLATYPSITICQQVFRI